MHTTKYESVVRLPSYTVRKVIQISAIWHEILHEIFRVVSRFPRYILYYFPENNCLWDSVHSIELMKTDDISHSLSYYKKVEIYIV